MNKYRIKISFRTGNSFNTSDEEDFLEYEWKNLDAAKKSLKHIKNHYEYYQKHSTEYTKPAGKLPDGVKWSNELRIIILELVADNGAPYRYSSFWTGYFEALHEATIELIGDSDMKYIP